MPKGTASKENLETRSYDKKLFLVVKFPEFLGSASYVININDVQQNSNVVVNLSALFINTFPNY